jgi:hypothetical protein
MMPEPSNAEERNEMELLQNIGSYAPPALRQAVANYFIPDAELDAIIGFCIAFIRTKSQGMQGLPPVVVVGMRRTEDEQVMNNIKEKLAEEFDLNPYAVEELMESQGSIFRAIRPYFPGDEEFSSVTSRRKWLRAIGRAFEGQPVVCIMLGEAARGHPDPDDPEAYDHSVAAEDQPNSDHGIMIAALTADQRNRAVFISIDRDPEGVMILGQTEEVPNDWQVKNWFLKTFWQGYFAQLQERRKNHPRLEDKSGESDESE